MGRFSSFGDIIPQAIMCMLDCLLVSAIIFYMYKAKIWMGVVTSLQPVCTIIRLPHSAAAGLLLCARRTKILIDSCTAGAQQQRCRSTALSSKCEQCHVDSWRMKLNTDLFILLPISVTSRVRGFVVPIMNNLWTAVAVGIWACGAVFLLTFSCAQHHSCYRATWGSQAARVIIMSL